MQEEGSCIAIRCRLLLLRIPHLLHSQMSSNQEPREQARHCKNQQVPVNQRQSPLQPQTVVQLTMAACGATENMSGNVRSLQVCLMSLSSCQPSCRTRAAPYFLSRRAGTVSCCGGCLSTSSAPWLREALHDPADGEALQAGSQPAKRAQKVALTHLDEEEDGEG